LSDVRVIVYFRNDLLERLIRESGKTIYQLCEEIPVSLQYFYQIKSLRVNPRRMDGEYSAASERIAAYFHLTPDILFPDEIYTMKFPAKLEKAIPATRIACLVSSEAKMRALPPHELAEASEMKSVLLKVLGGLHPREQQVIKMRFGLCEEGEHSLVEVGDALEVSTERVRQIETKAIRKLQQPRNTKHLVGMRGGR
jgi:RNA polymerase sigma factor (sigma-70 family)